MPVFFPQPIPQEPVNSLVPLKKTKEPLNLLDELEKKRKELAKKKLEDEENKKRRI